MKRLHIADASGWGVPVALFACPVCSAVYNNDLPACPCCGWCSHPELNEHKRCTICHEDFSPPTCDHRHPVALEQNIARWLRTRRPERT